ncbi:FkbM family methyltransferase/natural product biosynthesis luciferase-like monooxygenase protein [Flavobacterium sp. 9]|uniref:MupA/Atu3671 family FMN-dependent luciferase-like monooxygenase n=1 Tax=Flavobacterium sp. 9 TaxID=2035198 RepID=UPI000C18B271|nr:MupA/Atu3671 family FMN-dependent luciferase-like monooxygenase [Flavobacterium sp. 9]PIF30222.1 FkbM family methyltransferase/natural product biosynthesis luciferase-like monooxygenase protein [Flavobacterium sp. 9]
MGNLIIKQRLTQLIQEGISFEVSQGKLLVKGNLSALDNAQKEFLKDNKEEIISLIESQTQEIPEIKKTDKELPKPLSFSQQSLWLLDRINNGSSHYNLASTFKLKGKINYEALNQTFATILERHSSLRSSFFVDGHGEPVQKIQDVPNFNVTVEEIDPSIQKFESHILGLIEQESNNVFDLTQDLLLRVKLLKINNEEHILIVTMHHIASDGWSIGILVNEFNILYSSYLRGESNTLPELDIQYADYAYWQRQWLKGKVLDNQINYWKKQLADLPVIHSLPLDSPRPFTQTFSGNTYNSFVEKKTLTALYNLSKAEGATLFMAIHAAFSTLLARYSNEKDIVVGTPIANREKAEIANLVGFFMNLLVLRSDLSQEPSFRALLKQSKKMLEDSYEYQQMPFEKLVEELKVPRNLGHNPLFQVLLSLQNNTQEEISLSDIVLEPFNYKEGNSAKYDLSLNVTETPNGLILSWEYNTDLFVESTIVRMAEHFNTLLSSLLVNPDENVFKANLIGEKEANQIYEHLSGDVVEVSTNESAINFFDYQTKNNPNQTAIISNDVSYNYAQLGEKVDAIAGFLIDQGVQNGDKVGICLLRNFEMVATIFACFKLGAAYIPLDPVYSSERINQTINDAQPKCIVTLSALKELFLNGSSNEDFVYLDKVQAQKENQVIATNCSGNNVAYIIFTSGTTGKPKGIEVTHENLSNLLKGLDISFGSETKQTWLAQTSVNFDISVLEIIWTISRGHKVVLQQSNPFKLVSHDKITPSKNIDFSIMFFGADKNNNQKYDLLLDTVKYADQNNFTAIWTPERHFGEFGGAFSSPSVLSGAISTMTKNISIRSGSVVLPLHDPIRVAEEWSIVDNLSNGRVGISIASGWHPNDFVFSNSNYSDRHNEMREKITELKNLWEGNPIVRKNGVDKDFTIQIRPTPIQQKLPLWITAAGSPETFKYAGEIGANILTHMLGQTLEKLEANIAVYHQALKDNGFSIEDKQVSLMLHTYIDASHEDATATSEQPFKDYLRSSMKLMEPLAKELGLDIDTQSDEIIDIAYRKFSKENTLIGTPESCQKMLFSIQNIGVTEVACLVDFGVESEKVLSRLEKIVETKTLYHSQAELTKLLNIDNQRTELELIDTYKVTHVQMTPSQSKLIADLNSQDKSKELSSVQHWFIGGEPLNQNLINSLSLITNSKLYNMYGPTETTVWSTWREINSKDFRIGKPIINTNLLLLNEFEQQVPFGVVGELYIGGSGVAKGYYNNAELTNKSFKQVINSHFGNSRFYKTGDLMKLTSDGTFEYVGRKDNQVKVNGYRIELEEIEKTISKVPGVKNCKVLPITENNTTYLSAYVIKDDIVYGNYTELPVEEQAKPFYFPDGSTVYHQSDRQLAMLYKEIFQDGIYSRHHIKVPENGLVLDVGANIGTFSMEVNQSQPSATIIAFEPIPQIFSALKKNFEHRQIKGRILNFGVSNKKENATFHYYPEMSGMSGRFTEKETIVDAVGKYIEYDKALMADETYQSGEKNSIVKSFYDTIDGENDFSNEFREYLTSLYNSNEVECQLTTISDVIDDLKIEAIDLLKIDVEKSECLVLEGIREEHWPMIHQVAIEVDGDNNLNTILELLNIKGYEVNVDELVMSDAELPRDENTYMVYGTNHKIGEKKKDQILQQFESQTNETSIRDFVKKMLPDYMSPKDITFVPSIPLMENGKVDMMKLKEIKPQESISNNVITLNNKTELDIYRIWCEVLKKENIPYHVSIFEAGGNSIEIVVLHEKLQKEFGVEFSLIELFRNPTIPQQAKLIENANKDTQEDVAIKKAVDKGASRRNARSNRN